MSDWSSILLFLTAPFVMCLILAGIHCYLGLHVLARGVIFVDLSLAQVAALGATIGLVLGFEHHTVSTYLISLGCTWLAAWFFSLAKKHEEKFSQEAIIGIVYALSSAAVILIVDRTAHGTEHVRELMVGQLLWVTWEKVAWTGAIYTLVSLIHYFFRKQLITSSFEKKNTSSIWDFVFYALFGVVITSSVNVAGVLLVFTFLMVPSVVSSLFFSTLKAKLIFGWILGFVLSFFGLVASHFLDLPSGPLIVTTFTLVPVLLLLGLSKKK